MTKRSLLLKSTGAFLLAAALAPAGQAESLCTAGEHEFFSCTVDDDDRPKMVAICGSRGQAQDSTESYLQYRFGTRNHLEFVFPEGTRGSLDKFRWKHDFHMAVHTGWYPFTSDIERYWVSFETGGYEYNLIQQIYPRAQVKSKGPVYSAAVHIDRAGNTRGVIHCQSVSRNELSELSWLQREQ